MKTPRSASRKRNKKRTPLAMMMIKNNGRRRSRGAKKKGFKESLNYVTRKELQASTSNQYIEGAFIPIIISLSLDLCLKVSHFSISQLEKNLSRN